MEKNKLKIEYLPIKDIKPYEKNARKHKAKDVDNIARSIEKYGMNDPIGIWKDNLIVEGHGRLLACKKLGMDTVPVIRLDHLTDDERREYAIAHNATAELSEWADVLAEELADLHLGDFDFDFLGDKKNEDVEIKTVEVKPYNKVHYLLTLDVNDNDKVVEVISRIREMGCVEVESTLN